MLGFGKTKEMTLGSLGKIKNHSREKVGLWALYCRNDGTPEDAGIDDPDFADHFTLLYIAPSGKKLMDFITSYIRSRHKTHFVSWKKLHFPGDTEEDAWKKYLVSVLYSDEGPIDPAEDLRVIEWEVSASDTADILNAAIVPAPDPEEDPGK